MAVKAYVISVIGSREMNQDSFLVDESTGLFAVADGVGGGLRGEVASKMAVEGLKRYAPPTGSLQPAIERVQQEIYKEAIDSLGDALMGTTLTAIRVKDSEVTLSHVGDSHCYHMSQGLLTLMTVDHEVFDDTMGGPVLASYLGMPTDTHPMQIQNENFLVSPGDRILLCSDGLYRQMSETRIAQIITASSDPKTMLEAMAAEASTFEFSDNITIVYLEIS